MTNAELIYRGNTAEDLGISQIAYDSRKEALDRYLAQSGGVFDEADYVAWVVLDEAGRHKSADNKLPPAKEMAKDLFKSGVAWIKAGAKFVSEEDHRRRWGICQGCEYLTEQERCSKCGCWMEFKSKLAGMKCPEGEW